MCTVTAAALRRSSHILKKTTTSLESQHRYQPRKRAREGHLKNEAGSHTSKRVRFAAREIVLGTAQSDYDRSSFEVQLQQSQRTPYLMQRSTPLGDDDVASGTHAEAGDDKANFRGIWRRCQGYNWASLLELSGVDAASIPEQVRSRSGRHENAYLEVDSLRRDTHILSFTWLALRRASFDVVCVALSTIFINWLRSQL